MMTEREERLQEALRRLVTWADAYPTEIFPEPSQEEWKIASQLLRQFGMSIDRFSAAAMRHVATRMGAIAREALEGGE